MMKVWLILIAFFRLVPLSYAADRESIDIWSDQKAHELIQRINNARPTHPDLDAFYEFGKAVAEALTTTNQRESIEITAIPSQIVEAQDDMTATWFYLMVYNGHINYYLPLETLSGNNALASMYLGQCYLSGRSVEKDPHEGVKYLSKAACQGNPFAQNNLGWCFMNGKGVEKDPHEGVKYLSKAACQGNPFAQNNLGWCFMNGKGVEKNPQEAVRWWNLSALQGNSPAQNNLAWSYFFGRGVEENLREAVKWWNLAALQGNSVAQASLGWCFMKGIGVEMDLQETVKWYTRAALRGNLHASNRLRSLIQYTQEFPQEHELSPLIKENLRFRQENLEELLHDTGYWEAMGQNNLFKDSCIPLSFLRDKSAFLSYFYQWVLGLLPLLKDPEFAISCFVIQEEEFKPHFNTYQDHQTYYLSFNPAHRNLKIAYEENSTIAFRSIQEIDQFIQKLNLWVKKISDAFCLPQEQWVDHLEKIKKELNETEKENNNEYVQVVKRLLDKSLPSKETNDQRESVEKLQRLIDDVQGSLPKHVVFFTDLGESESETPPVAVSFKEIFESLIEQTALYRNHLFLKQYQILTTPRPSKSKNCSIL